MESIGGPSRCDISESTLSETLLDAGTYLIKSGNQIDEPGQMGVIKNDPHYNEPWPRALVPSFIKQSLRSCRQ